MGISDRKIIVLDDDPTGVQTVNGISVYTDWTEESIEEGFAEPRSMFYILTNSRAFSTERVRTEYKKIAERISAVAKRLGRKFLVISRSDSTLRGHYPLETEVLRETFERAGYAIDGEILMPFFLEGGRVTIGDVHCVREGERLIPAASTEFARDKTFGYTRSDLKEYIEEKTGGRYKAASVESITLEELRAEDIDGIAAKLERLTGFNKAVVNATEYADVEVFVAALDRALTAGKNFLFRTAAALPKVMGGVADRPLLTRDELIDAGNPNGGLIIIGSHVQKTTAQLEALRAVEGINFIEFDVSGDLEKAVGEKVIEIEKSLREGRTAAVYTSRRLITLPSESASLDLSVRISAALTSIVDRLSIRPRFLIAKGGITSSDVGTIGLHVRKALVIGQAAPGVPVWKIGAESKFPGLSYIIFPGNVGAVDTLKNIVAELY